MPPRDPQLRIDDILDAVEKIHRYTDGMTQAQFAADDKTVDAVVRNISVIGESAGRVAQDVISLSPDIPWLEMRDMRNVVIHEYFGVDKAILWETIQKDLPPLAAALVELKAKL